MLKKEIRYDFQKRLMQLHKPDRRDYGAVKAAGEWQLPEDIRIVIDQDAAPVIVTAARDLADYLLVSMGIGAGLSYKDLGICIRVGLCASVAGPIGYSISVGYDGITVLGSDPEGAAQGLFYLEDLMNRRGAPILKMGTVARRALFKMRLAHSPFGMFEYPDEAFAWMAHLGFNAIELWLKDVGVSLRGDVVNVDLLCQRAAKWGIKVYASLYQPHTYHPDDEGAQEFYDALYGDFFARCPDLGGICMVGEANQFQSRDPRVGKTPFDANFVDNIPTGDITPGWWPCEDYPRWVAMVRRTLDKVKPEAQILFSTYNWGYAPEEDRVAMLKNMPREGVIVFPTWDMFHQFKVGDVVEDIVDYSLRFAGPGEYFVSEAEACKKYGLCLGTNAQSSGRTWDFGVIPYEPMPWAWIDRYKGMQEAHDKWDMCAVLECIHYGFWPSFISYLEKEMFFTGSMDPEVCLRQLMDMEFGCDISEALRCYDDAIRLYIPTNEDQYGAFRTGPSYPLWLYDTRTLPDQGRVPMNNDPMWKGIYYTYYKENMAGRNSLPGVRVHEELKAIDQMVVLIARGNEKLRQLQDPNEELQRLLLMGEFMYCCCITAAHAKRFYQLKSRLSCCETRENAARILDSIEEILLAERKNVERAIEVVQYDSRLGWEASMEYTADAEDLRWKLRQLDYELTHTLVTARKSNALGTDREKDFQNAPIVIFH
ncbi:MAG: hypothetical protein IJO88_01675 [Oscillospiraceae bacterium]|nr:hypothetical protein [Oscillospiraceae bacterium]